MIDVNRSKAVASIHETAEGLHAAGMMDRQTMGKFNEACLTPLHPLTASAATRPGAGIVGERKPAYKS